MLKLPTLNSNLPSVLTQIIEAKMKRLAIQKYHMPMVHFSETLCQRAGGERKQVFSAQFKKSEMAVIAEVKKASPSKGLISQNFKPAEIAIDYEDRGASAISVLTEEDYFLGGVQVLEKVKSAVNCPILRKDFIIDPYQIYESAVIGADAILLIACLLDLETLKNYMDLSHSLGLEVLLEVHDQEDLEKAILVDAPIIGVNNRNLKTFQVAMETSLKLAPHLPQGKLWISESGIASAEDIKLLKSAGFKGVLIGETLMRQPDLLTDFSQI